MKTFREFSDICEAIVGPVLGPPIQRPTISTTKVTTKKPAGFIKPKPQKPSLMRQIGRLANTPVGRFAMNNVLRRMPYVKAASVVNAGPVADGTLDAARQKGYLK